MLWVIFLLLSCKSNLHEQPYDANMFKQMAIDAGVYDRLEFDDPDGLDSESIHWENASPEDFEAWKNFIELARAGIASEQRNKEEFDFVSSIFDQFEKEKEGLSRNEVMQLFKEYHHKYPKYFHMPGDAQD